MWTEQVRLSPSTAVLLPLPLPLSAAVPHSVQRKQVRWDGARDRQASACGPKVVTASLARHPVR